MLDFRIGMAPIVEDMKSKKTVGLFFLKDVFWLLRSGKFEFLDKPMSVLLKSIYHEIQDVISMDSEDEAEEFSEGESYEDIDEDEDKQFLEDLVDEDKNSLSQINKNISRSFAYQTSDKNVPDSSSIEYMKEIEGSSSLINIQDKITKEKLIQSSKNLEFENSSKKMSKKYSSTSDNNDQNGFNKISSADLKFKKKKTNDHSDSKFKGKLRTFSINSFGVDFK